MSRPATGALGDIRVNAVTTGNQTRPAVTTDLAGNIVVVWVDDRLGVANLFARRFAPTGLTTATGVIFRVNTLTTSGQYHPSVGRDSTGAFVVVWDASHDGSQRGIEGQRYDSAGAPAGGEFRVNTYTTGHQRYPIVAVSPAGSFAVVWAGAGSGDTSGVFLQRYSAAGAPLGGEVRVNSATTGTQTTPNVAMTSTGTFVAVWSSDAAGAGIRGQRYDAAGAPLGGEFAVGGATGVSSRPVVATDLTGGFVVAWEQSADFNDDVFARRFSSAGAPLTGEIRVNTFTTGIQEDAAVAVSPAGDFMVTWMNLYPEDGVGAGVFAQRYAATGEPSGPELFVNTFTSNNQSEPAVAAGANGGFVVAWQSFTQDAAYSFGVYGKTLFPGGADVDATDVRVNTYTTQDQRGGRVAMDERGSFVVVWASGGNQDGNQSGIFGQIFDVSGVPLSPEFRVNQQTLGNQFGPDVALLPAGGFVVAWVDTFTSPSNVLVRRYDDGGVALGSESRVNASTVNQLSTRVAASASGFVVTWLDAENNGDVKASRFSSDGAPLEIALAVNVDTSGQQGRPAIGMADDGSFVVAWGSYMQTVDGADVFVSRFAPDGTPLGGDTRVNISTATNQSAPEIAVSPAGDFVVVWQDGRVDNEGDIFARRFRADGTPLTSELRVNTYTTGSQTLPIVARGKHGAFSVVWATQGEGPGPVGLVAQRFGRTASPLGSPFRVNAQTTAALLFPTGVAYDPTGRFVVVYDFYSSVASRFDVEKRRFPALLSGDADGNGTLSVGDVFYLINNLFAGGPGPLGESDVNANGAVDVGDVFYLINFLFAGGAQPV